MTLFLFIFLISIALLASSVTIYCLYLLFEFSLVVSILMCIVTFNLLIYSNSFFHFQGDALEQNFVFSNLDTVEKQMLANAMEQVSVGENEDIITEGKNKNNYIYYILILSSFIFCAPFIISRSISH